jgi:2-keto-4-pentenoate hydratase
MTPSPLTEEWKTFPQDLARAWIDRRCLPVPAHGPTSIATAYRLQEAILIHLKEPIGGWKVGVNPEGGVWGSPLPCAALKSSQASFPPRVVRGLEVELAFRLSPQVIEEEKLLPEEAFFHEGILEMACAIEVVSSRFLGWPHIPELWKLADLQNHGALFLGSPTPYDPDFPYLTPPVSLQAEGNEQAKFPSGNPAGDPRALLQPFLRQCRERGLPIEPHHWITTGSYSGVYFLKNSGRIHATLGDLPPLTATLLSSPRESATMDPSD